MTRRDVSFDLSLELLKVVEQAAVACAQTMGQGDRTGSDKAAVEAMRRTLDDVPIDGTIVIGEGERDEAPMLFIGEKVGQAAHGQTGLPAVDIAVDPLEGTNLCATGAPNAIAVLAASTKGGLLHAPDLYMEKLVVGPRARHTVSLDRPVKSEPEGDRESARAQGRGPRRHGARPPAARKAHLGHPCGGRTDPAHRRRRSVGWDRGGARRLRRSRRHGHRRRAGRRAHRGRHAVPRRGDLRAARGLEARHEERSRAMGITDFKRIYSATDLASGDSITFVATGVTDGALMKGVRFFGHGIRTSSVVMQNEPHQIRFIDTIHVHRTDDDLRIRF